MSAELSGFREQAKGLERGEAVFRSECCAFVAFASDDGGLCAESGVRTFPLSSPLLDPQPANGNRGTSSPYMTLRGPVVLAVVLPRRADAHGLLDIG
jgi:hypothetical protein